MTTEPTVRDTTLNIHQRMHAVMLDVGYIQKNKMVDGKFPVVTHDAVTAKLRPSLLRHGILVIPSVESHNIAAQWESKTGVRMTLTECDATVAFINIDKPADHITVTGFGYGIDNQDKGPGKCMSYIVKMAMLKCFSLESGDDPDQDQGVDSPPPQGQNGQQGPPQGKQASKPAERPQGRSQADSGGTGGEQKPSDGRITDGKRRRLFAIAKENGWENDQLYALVKSMTGSEHTAEIHYKQYDAVIAAVEQGPGKEHSNELPDPTPADLEDALVDTEDDLAF